MSWLNVLGWTGSALLVISVMQPRVLRFRLLNLLACAALAVFNGLLQIWPMVALNLALCGINLWYLRLLLTTRHDTRTYEVLEVAPTDEYLRHVLRVHEADILTFQPDLVWDPSAGGHHAFLVQRGDETVGVVLTAAREGVAHVLLDYVTPRYRDFSPGEFVYRRSQTLRDAGFHRVVTPANMVDPYYEGLGFRRDETTGSWVLDLP